MELQSRAIHNKALAETAKKYNLTKKDTQKILKMYADYTFEHINNIELTDDLVAQPNRFIFPEVGGVRIAKEFLIFNEWRLGRLPKEIFAWCKVWFKTSIKVRQNRIDFYNKLNID